MQRSISDIFSSILLGTKRSLLVTMALLLCLAGTLAFARPASAFSGSIKGGTWKKVYSIWSFNAKYCFQGGMANNAGAKYDKYGPFYAGGGILPDHIVLQPWGYGDIWFYAQYDTTYYLTPVTCTY